MQASRLTITPMSLQKNVLATYASQIYVTLIGIFMVPVYVRYMGPEAYGLVGFFAMIQALFQLLDMGLTPTMARETAVFNGGAGDPLTLRRLTRALEGVFVAMAMLGAMLIYAASDAIATGWLKVESLPLEQVRQSIQLIGIAVALRWISGLYRGAVTGFEQLVWLSGFNISIATVRFIFVVPFFIIVGAAPVLFFWYQVAVAALELALLVAKTYRLLPAVPGHERTPWDWTPLRTVLKFSLSIAFTSSIWVLVTQTDKLLLSKLLSLSEYGYFTLAVLVAGGVGVISAPIASVLLPRLTRLCAQGDEVGMIGLYRQATQWVSIIAAPAALMLAFFAEHILSAWTGNSVIARHSASILALYALGNAFMALVAFPYYLQFAKGDLKLHLLGSGLFVVVLIPALVWATIRYGVVGAGYAWLGANVVYFIVWVPKVHQRFFPGLHLKWLTQDVLPVAGSASVFAALAHQVVVWPTDRVAIAVLFCALGFGCVVMAGLASSAARGIVASHWQARYSS